MLFWIGVPVNNKRLRHWKLSNVFHRPLDEFLIFCASSRIMYCHFTALKYCWSCRIYYKLIKRFMSPKRCCFTYQLITRDQNVERSILIVTNVLFTPEFTKGSTILDITPVRQSLQLGYKTCDFLLPIMKGRRRCNNQKGTPDIVGFHEIRQ